jgi:thiosulfate dehydrogenase
MRTSSQLLQRGRIGGLGVVLAIAAVAVLALVIGSTYFFDRSISSPIAGAYRAPAAPADAPASASTPVAAGAPEAARSDAPPTPAAAAVGGARKTAFTPPPEDTIPNDDYGKMIRLGENVFNHTSQYAGKWVGNDLNCVNCHLDGGRRANAAPLWAAFIHYPAFRSKTGKVDTLASRLQGCFQYSMNGKAPPADDPIMTALQTYAFFLAKGAPVGMPVDGSGYPKLKKPAQPPDFGRGEKVYAQNCALCHGPEGQGQRAGDRQVFPPLWGPRSFNWGAGMHQVNTAAAFIHANMPLGKGGSLSEQDAWDVAYFMDAHERPQDPRFTGSVAETRKRYHDSPDSLYGIEVNGHLLGSAPAGAQAKR